MKIITTVQDFIEASNWPMEVGRLREIILSAEMQEAIKWRSPCYSFNGKNIVGIGSFKKYFCLWFFQGVLLKDSLNVFTVSEKSKAVRMRQWKFNNIDEVKVDDIRLYLTQAIEILHADIKIKTIKKELVIPSE